MRAYRAEQTLQDQASAAGSRDDEVHDDHHAVVAPAIGAMFSPETGFPFNDFFLNGAEHDQNQPDGGELGENAKEHPQSSGAFGGSEKAGKTFAHLDVFAARFGVRGVFPSAGKEDQSDHRRKRSSVSSVKLARAGSIIGASYREQS